MTRKLLTLLFCLALIGANFSSSIVQAASWTSKVDPWLQQQGQALAPEDTIEFLVVLKEKGDLSGVNPSWTKQEKGAYVFQHLLEVARSTQGPVISELQSMGAETRAYWIVNMVWARGSWDAVRAAASRLDVEMVYGNPQIKQDLPDRSLAGSQNVSPDAIEWNILKVNADDVWAMGYTGQGVVIAGQDTGYQWDHPALVNHYRDQVPGYGRHDYNWHDAIHSGGGSCGANSPFPCDDYGHGTHTMGTMVGDDGGSNQVGMAPGAKWIGCRNMDVGTGTPATYLECFEFFLAPYPVNGTPDDGLPELAPDVMSNSWGCPPSEGCSAEALHAAVIAARAAGIMVVASAGNSGSSCFSVEDPIATYNEVFTVGATDSGDQIAGFSSRGPSALDGTLIKPDISAPGVNVRSSVPGGGYEGGWSGTSMAAPHVAGLVALLISAEPNLRGHIDQLEEIITQTALPRTSTQNCGGVPGSEIPNNTYGWGRIDALAAVNAIPHIPDAGFTAPASVNVGQPVQFTDTTTGIGPFIYDWDFGDGIGTSTEQNPVYTYTLPGSFIVTQVVSNTSGSDIFTGTIEVLPLIDVNVVSLTLVTTGTVYAGFPANFQAAVNTDATLPVSYVVDFGDGTPVITTTVPAVTLDFTHTFANPGTFTVTVWGLNNGMTRNDVTPATIELVVEAYLVDYEVYLPLLMK